APDRAASLGATPALAARPARRGRRSRDRDPARTLARLGRARRSSLSGWRRRRPLNATGRSTIHERRKSNESLGGPHVAKRRCTMKKLFPLLALLALLGCAAPTEESSEAVVASSGSISLAQLLQYIQYLVAHDFSHQLKRSSGWKDGDGAYSIAIPPV